LRTCERWTTGVAAVHRVETLHVAQRFEVYGIMTIASI
jgi:hypothetical protein